MCIYNTLDLETYIDKNKFIPYCICFNIQNSYISIYFDYEKDIIISFLDKVVSFSKVDYIEFYIHNLNFDGMIFIDHLSKSKIKYDIMSIGTDLFWIKIYYSGIVFMLRCSYKIIRLPLREIGRILNYKKYFFPYKFVSLNNINYVGEIPSREYWDLDDYDSYLKECNKNSYDLYFLKNETIEYCLRDIEILSKALSSILSIINSINKNAIKKHFSIASISNFIFFKNFNKFKKVYPNIKKDQDNYIRNSFFGGRCEVFGNLNEGEYIKYYDFSGMYSQCMCEKFQIGEGFFCAPNDISKPGFYSIDFESLDMRFPILPVKTNKLIFPNTKSYTGIYWWEEILYFVEKGGKIKKINNALIYKDYDFVFNDFVEYFKKIREKDGFFNTLGKNIINSFYGSTALRERDTKTYITYSDDEVQKIIKELNVLKISKINSATILVILVDFKYYSLYGKILNDKTKRNVSIASAISSKARIKLHKFFLEIENDGGRMLYCDTDSAFAAYDKKNKNEYINEKKWLKFYEDGFFAAPKSYGVLEKSSSYDIKLKGISKKNVSFYELKKKFYESDRILFEHQKISNKNEFFLKESKISKIIDFSKYDKRIFDENKKNTKAITLL